MPAITPDRAVPLGVNLAGVFIELSYCAVFLAYSPFPRTIRMWMLALAGEAAFFCAMAFLILPHSAAPPVLGFAAIALNVCMYASPVSSLFDAVRRESVEFLPLLPSVANVVNPAIWSAYAALVGDAYILAPNALGVVFGVVVLLVYARVRTWLALVSLLLGTLSTSLPGKA